MSMVFNAIVLISLGWAWFLAAIAVRNAILIFSALITRIEPIEMPEWYQRLTFFIANILMLVVLIASGLFALHAWLAEPPSQPRPNPSWPAPQSGTGSDVATPAYPAAVADRGPAHLDLPGSECAGAPSFDCRKARSATEMAICGDPQLGTLDCRLAAAYGELKQVLDAEAFGRIKSAQRAWLRDRDSCGAAHDCIDAKYQERTFVLAGELPVPRR